MKIIRILLLLFLPVQIFGQYVSFNPDTVKAGQFDMGKMWTFENPPIEYLSKTYNFKPSDEWLEKVRLAALRLSSGCSASFISEDGLVMTNHHCGRNIIYKGQKEGEDFLKDGFYAGGSENERRIPDLSLDQLVVVKDVTKEINNAMAQGKSDAEKLSLKDNKIDELIAEGQKENPELQYTVVPLYNGGKHSLYGYKKYYDVRLVFAPDLRTAKLGGDYDNFTYPRYGLDCMFFRAYEDGKPVKTENYFEWSEKGGEEGELVFVIGNPGSTSRINTVAQMEFERDYINKPVVDWLKDLYGIIESQVMNGNTENYKLVAELYSIGNGLKVYEGIFNGLNDPYLIARKGAFEKKFREAVLSDAGLKDKYGHLWDEIAQNREKVKPIAAELFGYNINKRYASELFKAAASIVRIAEERKADPSKYSNAQLDSVAAAFYPSSSDKELQERYIQVQVNIINRNLSKNAELLKLLFDGKTGTDAKNYMLEKTGLDDPDYLKDLIKKNPDDILKSDDPLIKFFITAKAKLSEYQKLNKSLSERDEINNGLLGEALYAVYGESIPPDATFTLRINDGVIKGYDYNGTRAPVMTTFYGVLDRYYSFKKRFPFNLPPVWENLPKDFDLSTPLNFITTNDIIGGNSGSPMINKDGKIVGLIFDGNMESLTADFIYTDEKNRAIAVHSLGMIEAIADLYGAKDLAKEILQGRK